MQSQQHMKQKRQVNNMVIGAIKTLIDVEKYIDAAILKTDHERNEMKRKLDDKQKTVNNLPRAAFDENNTQYANPEYLKEWEEFQQMQREFAALHDKADWLKAKKKELDDFEATARRRGLFTTKNDFKVELTLNDLQYLDIPPEELHPKGPDA